MKIVVLSIFILIFAYDSELLLVYLGSTTVLAMKFIVFLLLFFVVGFNNSRISVHEKYVIIILGIMHIYISFVSLVYSGATGLFWSFKFLIRFMSVIFLIMSIELYHLRTFVKWYRVLGLILSVQSILLFLAIYLNIPLTQTLVTRHGAQDIFKSFGIFGFANVNTGYSFRTQSFFSEATNFAKFLIFPFFSYLSEFFTSRTTHALLGVLIILIALLTTFSLTAFIGVLVGVMLFFVIRRKGRNGLIFLAPIMGITIFALNKGLTVLIDKGVDKTASSIISGGLQKGDESVQTRTEYLNHVLNVISDNPLGVGYYIEPFSSGGFLPIAPTRWLFFGGWMGLMIVLILHRTFLLGWRRSLNGDYYKLFLVVCVTQFIVSLVHGTWTEFVYWMNFVFLLKLSNRTNNYYGV